MSKRIPQNFETVQRRVADAARRVGRDPGEVQLVAVSKYHTIQEIQELVAVGQTIFGESRIQEALDKIETLRDDETARHIEWHMIGHLQTNKANKAAGVFRLFHGIDSVRAAEALQRAADRAGTVEHILLEANVSGEASKYGIPVERIEEIAESLRPFERVRCIGFMTMAPFEDDPENARSVFRGLRRALARLRERGFEHLDLRHLSMGMTNDFEIAVEEGATLVRVGTALFE